VPGIRESPSRRLYARASASQVLFAIRILVFRKDGSGVQDSGPKPFELLYDLRARGYQRGRRRDAIFQLIEQRPSDRYLVPKRFLA
jgi:hypothetical protein